MAKKKPAAKRKAADKKEDKIYKKGRQEEKVEFVMDEFKKGKLHSSSKKGPKVKNPKQALAIALSSAGIPKKKKKK
jgi:uncharacterized membrane protein